MFCSNCGTKLADNSMFCSNCGTKLGEGNSNTISKIPNPIQKNDFNKFGTFILDCFKNPTNNILEITKKLTLPLTCIYSVIFSIFICIITSISLRGFTSDIITFFTNLSNGFSFNNRMNAITTTREILQNYLPFSQIFLWKFLSIAIFFLLTTLFMFIIFSLLMKKNIPFVEYLKIMCVALCINCGFSLLESITLFVSVFLSAFVFCLGNIIVLVILFNGFKELVKEDKVIGYVFSFFYLLSMFLSSYITLKSITSYYINSLTSFF